MSGSQSSAKTVGNDSVSHHCDGRGDGEHGGDQEHQVAASALGCFAVSHRSDQDNKQSQESHEGVNRRLGDARDHPFEETLGANHGVDAAAECSIGMKTEHGFGRPPIQHVDWFVGIASWQLNDQPPLGRKHHHAFFGAQLIDLLVVVVIGVHHRATKLFDGIDFDFAGAQFV